MTRKIRWSRGLTRRQALSGLAASSYGMAGVGQVFAEVQPEKKAVLLPGTEACILTPQAVEGPFYFDPKLERSDITEGKPGVPLRLTLQIVEAGNCSPLQGARVDVWHADALGQYSGYRGQGDDRRLSTEGMHFLRGTQFSDSSGIASFNTIYPGWYAGRTPHIHFKVFLDQKTLVTGQIYFPDALSEYVYNNVPPYNQRQRQRDTVNATDSVLKWSGGDHSSFCTIKEEKDFYVASLIIGVDRSGAARSRSGDGRFRGNPPPPPPGTPAGEGPGGLEKTKINGPLVPGITVK